MKGKLVTLKQPIIGKLRDEQYQIVDIIIEDGNTTYLICDEPGKVYRCAPGDILSIAELKETSFIKKMMIGVMTVEKLLPALKAYLEQIDGNTEFEHGLYHDMDHLREIYPHILKEMTIEQMAKYADIITRQHVELDKDLMIDEYMENPEFKIWNATSVGNTAYIACHYENDIVRLKAKDLIVQWKEYIEKNFTGTTR